MISTLRCSIAENADAREQVYRLRYGCYFRKGSIDPRGDQRFPDRFDELPNHFSFLVTDIQQQAQATVRISVVRPDLGWTESPGRTVFNDHPAVATLAGEGFVEASRLCFGQQARRDALMQLLGHMAAMADFYQVGWLMACPRMEHAPIYQRQFGFRAMAEPRPYHGVKFETQLLAIRRGELKEYVREKTPMRKAWCDALANLGAEPGALRA